ncbi:MAG TPA: hypothetical protein VFX65_07855 [Candidatus Limnocylindrales bacterium]|nr:hypothetical protein [Candidatus Limnocylindrales bacterium]
MSSTAMGGASGSWVGPVRALFFVAMAVFLLTIGIGLLNGLDLVTFSPDQLLTHVHSGTIGWITLSLVAASAWFNRGIDARLAWAMAVIVPAYVLAFLLGIASLRAVLGVALLVAILWLLVWAWGIYGAKRSLPALAIALGFTTFTYGAVIGVLRQVQLAGGPNPFSSTADPIGAHASAMVFSYLILVAMGLLEWRLRGTSGVPVAGLVQLGALFAGGLVLSGALLFLSGDAVQAAGGVDLLVNIVAVAIFVGRVLPAALRSDWTAGAGRHLAASAIFVVVAMAIFLYVVYKFITDPAVAADPTTIGGVLVASDHSAFIGVITNLVFGVLLLLTADRADRWPWATQVAFWGTNGGLAVFIVGLVAESSPLKMLGAPVMGVSLLVGLAVLAMRLRDSGLRDDVA